MGTLQPLPYQIVAKAPELNSAMASFDAEGKKSLDERRLLSLMGGINTTVNQIRENCGGLLTGEQKPEDVDPEEFLDNYNTATHVNITALKEAEALLAQGDEHLRQRYGPMVQAARGVMDVLNSMRNPRDAAFYPLPGQDNEDTAGSLYGGKE
ncbi:MAG: hypothetical protein Q7R81_04115 [Candidatus Peregrinibacteria bacterium]|nr:hypothetical protein [Candidatus Peregrinibacteria bacterium]